MVGLNLKCAISFRGTFRGSLSEPSSERRRFTLPRSSTHRTSSSTHVAPGQPDARPRSARPDGPWAPVDVEGQRAVAPQHDGAGELQVHPGHHSPHCDGRRVYERQSGAPGPRPLRPAYRARRAPNPGPRLRLRRWSGWSCRGSTCRTRRRGSGRRERERRPRSQRPIWTGGAPLRPDYTARRLPARSQAGAVA